MGSGCENLHPRDAHMWMPKGDRKRGTFKNCKAFILVGALRPENSFAVAISCSGGFLLFFLASISLRPYTEELCATEERKLLS